MYRPALLLIVTLSFCVTAFAQSGPRIAFDLRSGSENTRVAGSTNSRSRNIRSADSVRFEREVFDLLNAERRSKGLNELEWSDQVAAVARMHSQNMADNKFFSHRGSDGSMVDDRADRVGLGAWRMIGENIAYVRGFEDPAATAVEKWIESTAHRKNLLGPNWTESAVGVVITADGTYYLTQVFLRRK